MTDLTNPTDPIECDDALLLSAAAAERTLEPTAKTALDQHLARCATCRDASGELAEEDEWVSVVRVPLRAVERAPDPDLANLPIVDPSLYAWGETIGQGGMGRVVAARDRRLGRKVAIKELLSDRLETRFAAEALITARLQHPAIVNVHEAGRWPSGEPFYTMKLVTGSSLSETIREKKTLSERMALLPSVMAVADAIAYAHSERIIHRDLKPSNVVLGPFGETVVIDWGLAKDLSDAGATPLGPFRDAGDGATQAGLGTPQYMPPEQARGETPDERVDVYALGASIYHLLDGEPPYGRGTASELLSRLAKGAPPPISERQPAVPPDLAAIVDKAMARDKADRYADARAVSDDLRRFQAGQLVGAFHYSPWALVRRWVGRHKAAVVAAVLAVMVAAAGATFSVRKILVERRRAEAALVVAERERAAVLLEQGRAELLAGRPMRALPYLSDAYVHIDDARTRLMVGEAGGSVDPLLARLPLPSIIDAVAVSPRGDRVVVAAGDQLEIRGFDPDASPTRLLGHRAQVTALDWSDDGNVIASASADNSVRRWGADGTARGELLDHGNAVRTVTVHDGQVLSTGDDGTVRGWDGGSASTPRLVLPEETSLVAVDRAGSTALVTWHDHAGKHVRLVGAGDDLLLPDDLIAPDVAALGRDLAGGGLVAAMATGSELVLRYGGASPGAHGLRGHTAPITALAFTRDGARLLSGDASGALLVWDVARAALLGRVVGHEGAIRCLAVDALGRVAATGGADGTVRVWRLDGIAVDTTVSLGEGWRGDDVVFLGGEAVRVQASSPAGDRVVRSRGGAVEIFDAARGTVIARRDGVTFSSVFSPDGGEVASVIGDRVVVWNAATGVDRVTLVGHTNLITAVAYAADGSLVTASRDGTGRIWNPDGTERALLRGHSGSIEHLAVAHGVAATGGFDGAVRIWRLVDGELLARVASHASPVDELVLSADGRLGASAGDDGVIELWSVLEAEGTVTIVSDHGPVVGLAFHPGGHFLAVAHADGVTELRDVERGVVLVRRAAVTHDVRMIRFTSDGDLLLAESTVVHRWRLRFETRAPDVTLRTQAGFVNWVVLNGRLVPFTRTPPGRRPLTVPADMTYDFSGVTIRAAVERPEDPAIKHALGVATTSMAVDRAVAQLEAATAGDVRERARWYAALADRLADASRVDDAIAVNERLLAMAPPALAASAHAQRGRLARIAGDPERAMAEAVAAGSSSEALAELAARDDRLFARSQDDRYGRAALSGYRAIAAAGGAPAQGASVLIADLERRLAGPRGAGSLDKASIRAAFVERVPAFTACYRQVLEREPTTRGTITIKATVGNDGRLLAHEVSPMPGPRGLSAVSACVEGVAATAVFPRMRWSSTTVIYFPLVLRPEP